MNRSNIEQIIKTMRDFFAADFNAEIAAANARAKAINPASVDAPALKEYTAGPVATPFPGMNINLDSFSDEESGQCTTRLTLRVSVNIGADMNTAAKLGPVLLRYMDALRDFVNAHIDLGGAVDGAIIESGDKQEEPNSGRGYIMATLVANVENTTY